MYICAKLSPPGGVYSINFLGIKAAIVKKIIIIKKIQNVIIRFLLIIDLFFMRDLFNTN